ncbi:MAG: type II toxin-antitoxin system VapC family toxin [Bacteroidales bacterium]|jgi:predicted nucleic acid-binding protein|nr:type II toxin-antitoxin system VapC family toxin [Bacteroidales bacterium]
MESAVVCLDTSILIDFYRKIDKSKSVFFKLTETYSSFVVSAITEYELYLGNSDEQNIFWNKFFAHITVLPFDTQAVKKAVEIYKQLRYDNKLIEIPDILIAATTLQHNVPIATLNKKHFERIKGLQIVS